MTILYALLVLIAAVYQEYWSADKAIDLEQWMSCPSPHCDFIFLLLLQVTMQITFV